MKPQRIQLSRKKGFNLQRVSMALNGLAAVVVSQPTRFGNPFWKGYGCRMTAAHHYLIALQFSLVGLPARSKRDRHFERIAKHLPELRGKNLACWCPKDMPDCYCHAGMLLEIANR